ncbi:hypothetical protein, partial [Sporosarcina sp. P20a]|uniref:hypothetical protein n=1 Tax=Sporosarcina sp. P20a TaxID=2048256 RepID=UPI001E58447B
MQEIESISQSGAILENGSGSFCNRASATSSVINAFGMKIQEIYYVNFNFTTKNRNDETMFS